MTRGAVRFATLACLVLTHAGPAFAQAAETRRSQQETLAEARRQKAESLRPDRVSPTESRIRKLEDARFPGNVFVKGFRGIRPVIGGMPSGSGLVGGIGYVRGLDSERYRTTASAGYSTRGFSQLSGRIDAPTRQSGRPVRVFVNAAYQDYPGLRFFGLGNASRSEDRVFYGQRTTLFGGGVVADVTRFIRLEADASRRQIEWGPANREPSLEESGLPVDSPFDAETTFNVYGGTLTVNLLDRYGTPPVGLDIRLGGWRYDDRNLHLGSFTRVTGEVRARVPLGVRNRRIALRLRTSHSTPDDGQAVPFYLMETIGGAATLRGYREYRFRDTRNLLMSAEYRWETWTYMDMALFYDAGKVFTERHDLNFEHLHPSYGVGVRVRVPEDVFLNIDLARSREGFRLHIGGGPRF